MQAGPHVKCPLLLSDFNQKLNAQTNFSEKIGIEFYENVFIVSRVGQANRRIFCNISLRTRQKLKFIIFKLIFSFVIAPVRI
jgi:hypothetical protein